MIGSKLAHYEITAHLGSGGMGEVYQATDLKLKRSVAIKILPEAFSSDSDRLSRFRREAQLLASLNHPNIAHIYGLEESGDTRCIAMELVEGETLQAQITRGPIPLDEALTIAKQICEALEAAHEKGVIHRDLKPGNVMLTTDGRVKVLDFGLAKTYEANSSGAVMSNSPTLASMGATNAGIILGTAAYMSPEQAKGRAVDRRTDIFAFGCVLFEMLSGRRAFEGEDVSDILSAVLRMEPDWTRLPADVPPAVRKLLRLCLEKNAKNRRGGASDVRIDIEQSLQEPANEIRPSVPARSGRLAWIAAAIILPLVAAVVTTTYLNRSREKPEMVSFDIHPPDKSMLAGGNFSTPALNAGAISPDGRTLAFTAQGSAGLSLLWLRPLATSTAYSLRGTDDATLPFWSPDGRSVGFFAQGSLKTIEVSGGSSHTLSDVSFVRGGTWSSNGTIVFAGGQGLPLYKVSSAGGEAVAATRSPGVFPSFLPDGLHFVYQSTDDGEIYLGSLDTLESKHLLTADAARYAPQGYLLFVQQGSLMAQNFDTTKLELSGSPILLSDSISAELGSGFSVSNNGALAFRKGFGLDRLQLAWFDRTGKLVETVGPPGGYAGVDLAGDGKRIALHRHDGAGGDVWVFDSASGARTRLTLDAAQDNSMPIWSPDGNQIVFASLRKGKWGLYQKSSDPTSNENLLLESDLIKVPWAWSPDGKFIVFGILDHSTSSDIWLLPMTGGRNPVPIVNSRFSENWAQVSANGKWLAYASSETGRREIYVRSFPSGEGRVQISTNGGSFPRWRADGKELFYQVTQGGKLVAVTVVGTGSTFHTGKTQELFDTRQAWAQPSGHRGNFHVYAVSPDGQRFLLPRPAADLEGGGTTTPITVILNWTELLNSKNDKH